MADEDTKQGAIIEIGSSGLKQYGGVIREEFLPQLSGAFAIKVFREMSDNDPVVGAFLYLIDMLVRQVDWRVAPASEAPSDKADAEFVDGCLTDMEVPLKSVISEAMTMLPYGWSAFEECYKLRHGPDSSEPEHRSKFKDGLIGWRKFAPRPQDTLYQWDFNDAGDVVGFVQQAPPRYNVTYIPREKMLLFRTSSRKNNPEGRSLLRNAYRPWWFKKRIEEIEGIGIERDLAGLPVIHVPQRMLTTAATTDEMATVAQLKRIVTNIRRDAQEGVLFPRAYDDKGNELFKLELLSTGGRRQFDTTAIVNRYDARIAGTVLADFLLLGHESVGSFALTDSKTSVFLLALKTILDDIRAVFNEDAIPDLLRLNGRRPLAMPTLEYSGIDNVDIKTVAEVIGIMAKAGSSVLPNAEIENHMLRQLNLPEITPEDLE